MSLSSPQLLHGDGLQLLKAEDGEIGLSFDKKSTRHFFLLGKSLNSPKFSLTFKVSSLFHSISQALSSTNLIYSSITGPR